MFEAAFAIALMLTTTSRSLDGTLVRIDNGNPSQIVIQAEGQFQTFALTKRVVVDRESTFANAAATTVRIKLADLTPGEYVRLQIDAQGHVTKARAVANVERARVRSANDSIVVLEDGTTLTIGSVLRFVNEKGKPSPTATLRSGETVLLFRHPQTRNIYRFSAEPRITRLRKRTDAS